MSKIIDTINLYKSGEIDKQKFIESMHVNHHSTLFDYSNYISQTNIKKIEIEN
jgi:hypothetical protein